MGKEEIGNKKPKNRVEKGVYMGMFGSKILNWGPSPQGGHWHK